MKSWGLKSVTSPAIRDAKPEASNFVMFPIPDFPEHTASQFFVTPVPRGVTIPNPVTTTRLAILSFLPMQFWFSEKCIELTRGKTLQIFYMNFAIFFKKWL
jgi:hypothetical protein